MEKPAFPYVMGGRVCILQREIGQYLAKEKLCQPQALAIPPPSTFSTQRSRDTCLALFVKEEKAKCLPIGYTAMYSHNGIRDNH